jgi:hypothetical protein
MHVVLQRVLPRDENIMPALIQHIPLQKGVLYSGMIHDSDYLKNLSLLYYTSDFQNLFFELYLIICFVQNISSNM